MPEIEFRKISPIKYVVKVKGTRGSFWLVFSESFHPQWRAYVNPVKEARHLQKFTPQDIKYLFRKEDIKEHYQVNGYANGWYIDPEELGLGEDFIVTLYFWPQALFYLGLFISGFTLIGCVTFLGYSFYKNNRNNRRT